MIGIDPGPLTIRTICWMAHGAQQAEWGHTSAILALTHNVNCSDKGKLKSPDDFNPVGKSDKPKRRVSWKEQVAAMKPKIVGAG